MADLTEEMLINACNTVRLTVEKSRSFFTNKTQLDAYEQLVTVLRHPYPPWDTYCEFERQERDSVQPE